MKNLLKASHSKKIRKGEFNIDINFPGLAVSDRTDPRGLGQLGRFDHGRLHPGVFVGMHPHKNDEILSYLRAGDLIHEDTEGEKTVISNTKLMMMNAGSGIYHQESIPEDGQEVEMLQIFLRPSEPGLKPTVQFYDFSEAFSLNKWRLIAGPGEQGAPLEINSEVSIFDSRLEKTSLPLPFKPGKTYVLYLFSGKTDLGGTEMETGDLLVYNEASLEILADGTADLVLFELDLNASYTRRGMYSGV